MLANLQTQLVNVQSPTITKGTSGGEKLTYSNSITAMPCRVIDASAQYKIYYNQLNLDITHQVFTNQGPTIKAGYQLIWGTRTLRVIGVVDLGGAGAITRIDCQELLTGG